jgi:hypothetical protein
MSKYSSYSLHSKFMSKDGMYGLYQVITWYVSNIETKDQDQADQYPPEFAHNLTPNNL